MPNYELPPTQPDQEISIVDFLSQRSGLSKAKIKDAMTKGAVWLERHGKQKRIRRAKTQLTTDDKVAFYYSEKILIAEPPPAELIDDRKTFSVWIKPVGLMSGGSRFGDHFAINRVIERQLDRPTFLVHRLDRFVWGLMVLAHSKKAAANLSAQFQSRATQKTYQAIVHGELKSALTLTQPIEGKEAISHVKPIRHSDGKSLIEIRIETGRKHQIRTHLAEAGLPIVGDRQYGSDDLTDMQLAAVELGFADPTTGDQLNYELPLDQRPAL